jgi:hypothetical protein
MIPTTRHRFLAAGLALAGVLGVAGTASAAAGADGPIDFEAAKARCIEAITVRHAEIAKLGNQAGAAANLTDAHEGTIDSFLAAADSGLTALQATIEADTEPAALRAHCESIATDYRIYALRSPQVHLAIGADRAAAAITKADGIVARLETAIDEAAAAGKDVTAATAALEDMKAKLADAATQLSGVVDTELTYTPADWNANHSVLGPTTSALRAVKADLQAAMADARLIIADLKD